jgi:hypothetical protein
VVRAIEVLVPHRVWASFAGMPVTAAITTRDGGISTGAYESLNLGLHVGDRTEAVIENRRRAARIVGLDLDDLVFGEQVHGAGVAVVGPTERGRGTRSTDDAIPGVDALVTSATGVGLVVLVADCVPLALYAPDIHAVAVVHAGWRGLVAGVIGAAVDELAARGASIPGMRAGIGPAITVDRYEIGPEVVADVRDKFGSRAGELLHAGVGDRWHFDLQRAARCSLRAAGISGRHIEVMATATGPGTPFFSDRAARPCGRFGVIACLEARA